MQLRGWIFIFIVSCSLGGLVRWRKGWQRFHYKQKKTHTSLNQHELQLGTLFIFIVICCMIVCVNSFYCCNVEETDFPIFYFINFLPTILLVVLHGAIKSNKCPTATSFYRDNLLHTIIMLFLHMKCICSLLKEFLIRINRSKLSLIFKVSFWCCHFTFPMSIIWTLVADIMLSVVNLLHFL